MLRIRRIFDDLSQVNQQTLKQVSVLLKQQFDALKPEKIDRIPNVLRDPIKHGFRTILYAAEDNLFRLQGLALLDYDADLSFCFLDYLTSQPAMGGRGIGGALYDRVRAEALLLGVTGIFFECLPDDAALCRDPRILEKNRARMRFYEQFDARPIIGTAYETPVTPGGDNPPYLVFDSLGQNQSLSPHYLKKVVESVLRKKYPDVCTPGYVRMVVDSISDDPVRLRPNRYNTKATVRDKHAWAADELAGIALVVNDQHAIHHVKERGYVETPARIDAILSKIMPTGAFVQIPPAHFGDGHIAAVHARDYLTYFKKVSSQIPEDTPLYPYVFPLRNRARPPVDLAVRAGYYCMDTFTPISRQSYAAARFAVDCTLTATQEIVSGRRIAYALVRPPGHHAESGYFGGFCYFNNAAIAAQYLSAFGRVAMLDVDYHHGNGQQAIFYRRNDVLTVSIHGHPRFAYPYFSGYADEQGEGAGLGFNLNLPLPEQIDAGAYLKTLDEALRRLRDFEPTYIVVCLGLDTAKGDPTGTWSLAARDFAKMGKAIGALAQCTLVVQEGGYRTRSLGENCKEFLLGIREGMGQQSITLRRGKPRA
ncbi:MAG: histone deacetylase family protein [Lentisphaerae bacterium]|nr:histone deacetylase family protein [Lentisphaerota bacterium]